MNQGGQNLLNHFTLTLSNSVILLVFFSYQFSHTSILSILSTVHFLEKFTGNIFVAGLQFHSLAHGMLRSVLGKNSTRSTITRSLVRKKTPKKGNWFGRISRIFVHRNNGTLSTGEEVNREKIATERKKSVFVFLFF